MKVIIAGAGIGGLTAALCLAKAGHEVQLIERSREFLDVGAGIQCGANANFVMQHLGVIDHLNELAVMPGRVEFRDYLTGNSLHSIALGQSYQEKFGAPYLHLHRADLHNVLLEKLKKKTQATLQMNTRVVSYTEELSFVQVNLCTGDKLEADLLIGADGINSTIRNQMLGNTPATFTGNIAWRGIVPVERLPDGWMESIVSNFVGPSKHMVLYYLRQKRLANFVGVVESDAWADHSWTSKASWEELSNDFLGWHPVVREIIEAVDKDSCYRWALHHHKPLTNWSAGRVTLLGDAAHSTLPFMASGAAMAIEDGRVLQRAIDQASTVSEGLKLYQRNRFTRTSKIQSSSARVGNLYHFKNSLMRKAAFTALKTFGAKQEAFLPDYDANTVKLT